MPLPLACPLQERVASGQGLPEYIKNHIIYYAGPAKTPEGYASGSFGPTTAGERRQGKGCAASGRLSAAAYSPLD
jgi:tartrate dehydratase beta subunit/fumarate hydratase class I family protein